MMIIYISVILCFCVLLIFRNKMEIEHQKKMESLYAECFVKPFSVSEYMDRREKVMMDILKDKKEPYCVTLWWNYDGLRMNEDGTMEWISKKPKEPPKYVHGDFSLTNACCSIATETELNRSLLDQLQATQTQIAQMQQNQMLINALHPMPYPQYSCCTSSLYSPFWNCQNSILQ